MEQRRRLDREAMALAEWLLGMARCGMRPPIPIEDVARCLGAKVWGVHLPAPIRGVCDVERRIILVNSGLRHDSRRFVVAHEIGELLVMDLGLNHGGWQNQFAAHLLAPMTLLKREAPGRGIKELAEIFLVGESVIAYQLRCCSELKE